QRIALQLLDSLVRKVAEEQGFRPPGFIFLDGLDEVRQTGDIAVALEELAESLTSASLVVSSRNSPALDRLGYRTAFDRFELQGLTMAEAVDFVRQAFPARDLPPAVIDRMISASQGSPLVLRMLASLYKETGEIEALDGQATIGRLLERVLF